MINQHSEACLPWKRSPSSTFQFKEDTCGSVIDTINRHMMTTVSNQILRVVVGSSNFIEYEIGRLHSEWKTAIFDRGSSSLNNKGEKEVLLEMTLFCSEGGAAIITSLSSLRTSSSWSFAEIESSQSPKLCECWRNEIHTYINMFIWIFVNGNLDSCGWF